MQEHGPKRRKEHSPQKRGIYTSHSRLGTLSQLRGCQGVVRDRLQLDCLLNSMHAPKPLDGLAENCCCLQSMRRCIPPTQEDQAGDAKLKKREVWGKLPNQAGEYAYHADPVHVARRQRAQTADGAKAPEPFRPTSSCKHGRPFGRYPEVLLSPLSLDWACSTSSVVFYEPRKAHHPGLHNFPPTMCMHVSHRVFCMLKAERLMHAPAHQQYCTGLSVACMQYHHLGQQKSTLSGKSQGEQMKAFKPGFFGRTNGFGKRPEYIASPASFAQRNRRNVRCLCCNTNCHM